MQIDMAQYPAGVYTIEITGTVGIKVVSFKVDVELMDPCLGAPVTLLPSPINDDTYILRDPFQTQIWRFGKVFTIDTLVDCGPVHVDFFNAVDQTPLDVALF